MAVVGLMASIALGACNDSPISSEVTYTDECQVTYYPLGNQSGMEDCDLAETQASGSPGATVQQLIENPDGTSQWVPPTGNWG